MKFLFVFRPLVFLLLFNVALLGFLEFYIYSGPFDIPSSDVRDTEESFQEDVSCDCLAPLFQEIDGVSLSSKVADLLKKDFFRRTVTPISRGLHSLPIFKIDSSKLGLCCSGGSCGLRVLPFFNQTGKIFFSGEGPLLDSYVGFGENSLIRGVSDLIAGYLVDLVDSEELLSKIWELIDGINIFRSVKAQERRAGVYISGRMCIDRHFARICLPVYYLERNLFLSEYQTEFIAQLPYIDILGAQVDDLRIQEALASHLVSDKLSVVSDVYLEYLYDLCRSDKLRIGVGGLITLPTAFAVKRGFVGGPFDKQERRKNFNIEAVSKVFCSLVFNSGHSIPSSKINFLRSELSEFFLDFLDNFSAMVLEAPPGDAFNIGPVLELDYCLNDATQLSFQFMLKKFFSRKETRFFNRKANVDEIDQKFNSFKGEFNKDGDACNSSLLDLRVYKFLDELVERALFPVPLRVKVCPGASVEFSLVLNHHFQKGSGFLGLDFWWKSREEIKFIRDTPECKKDFLVSDAINGKMSQFKLFGGLTGKINYCSRELYAGIRGDIAFKSKGVGRDFMIALDLGCNF